MRIIKIRGKSPYVCSFNMRKSTFFFQISYVREKKKIVLAILPSEYSDRQTDHTVYRSWVNVDITKTITASYSMEERRKYENETRINALFVLSA